MPARAGADPGGTVDNWDDLRFVVALARYGSMSQAARHLKTNTATVSRRIRRINETAGTTLFLKGQNDWELTSEGRKVFEIAARFSDDLTAFTSDQVEAQDLERVIRVTAVDFLVNEVLAPALPTFLQAHPNIALELSATDQKLSLAFGEADIALRLTRPTEGRLLAKRIANIRMGVYGPARSEDWIGLPADLDWTPEMKNGRAYFGKSPKLRLSSFRAILQGIAATGLAGIAPQLMASGHEGLHPLQTATNMRVRELWLVYHETRKNDAALRDTCKWIEQAFNHLQ